MIDRYLDLLIDLCGKIAERQENIRYLVFLLFGNFMDYAQPDLKYILNIYFSNQTFSGGFMVYSGLCIPLLQLEAPPRLPFRSVL